MDDPPRGAVGLAVGCVERVGRFLYCVPTNRWWWSDGMYQIHGFEPAEVPPSTEVLLAHKHPDDADHAREVIARVLETGEPFSCYHRIIDARRRVRHVVAVGDAEVDRDGAVAALRGFLVDLTESRRRDTAEQADAAVRGAIEHRAAIEQAKGAIMFAYGIDADAAFTILSACSQRSNIKVNVLARRLLEVNADGASPLPAARRRLGEMLEGATGGEGREALPA